MSFAGRVVIVTGAGGGLGRVYALEFGRRGAKVVVNDLGTSTSGEGAGNSPAAKVVQEIKAAGGEAVANFDSVENGEAIVKTAMDTYGRIDIVINNAYVSTHTIAQERMHRVSFSHTLTQQACCVGDLHCIALHCIGALGLCSGILRDVSFMKMTDAEWEIVNRVHLRGSYSVSRAAWNVMREQKFGRIIMTTSAAGIYGNFGQANYSAAKLGIAGLANTLAIEGKSRNIHVNTIAPVAGTRMTATVMPQDLVDALKPEYVMPLVLHLCHDSTDVTGGLFEVGAGWVSTLRWERSPGHLFPISKPPTPEQITADWQRVVDFTEPTYPTSTQDSMGIIMTALDKLKSASNGVSSSSVSGKSENVDPEQILKHTFAAYKSTYTTRDVALYALSVGAAQNQLDDQELSFVYENHPQFQALPTLGIVFPFGVLGDVMSIPGLSFNPMMLLHGEQLLEIKKPIPTSGQLTNSGRVVGCYDKGKGVVLVVDTTTTDDNGDEIVHNQFSVFIRGIGGYGGERGPAPEQHDPPARAPDAVHTDKTADNQALWYRLSSGDLNPLHADPNMAAIGGFAKPILHGMCTYGHAGRAVLKHFCNNDPSKFKAIGARMASHVFPGETIVTEMWKVSDTKVVFRCKVQERDKVVLANAFVTIAPSPAAAAPAAAAAAPAAAAKPFKSAAIFAGIAERLKDNGASVVKKINAVYEFKISGGPGGASQSWTIDLKSGSGSVSEGSPASADCTIKMADKDLVGLFTGKLNAVCSPLTIRMPTLLLISTVAT
jgi:(3R)-3-hydroxyacyl-CoA dehydrogenase / 3a,7a,12a-trihydroxy-5b-cholest-24-enoyl-CoA hydratase / enoyl-CoA hydratase 2